MARRAARGQWSCARCGPGRGMVRCEPRVNEEDSERFADEAPLRVAAIGGSTGWPAVETVLAALPPRPGFALIALAAADDVAPIVARLRTTVQPTVVEARDGVDLDTDHVYVVPGIYDPAVHHGRLRLHAPVGGQRAPPDRVLRSRAAELGR